MQDIAIAIGEMIHELVNSEIERRLTENFKEELFEKRLAALEKQVSSCVCGNTLTAEAKRMPEIPKIRMKGANIIAIRKHLNLSQATFARLLGVDRSCVNRWEHNKIKPSLQTVERISEYRGMGKKELASRLQKLEDEMWNS